MACISRFVTAILSGETELALGTMRVNILYRVSLNSHYKLWGLVMGTKTVKFCIGTHVRKRTSSPLQSKYPLHMLNSTTSAACCRFFMFWVQLDSGPMNILIYETPVESEDDFLARVMATADVGLPVIGDRVHQNMVRRCRAYVLKSLVVISSPSCKWTHKQISVQ